ncbi:hypothetical protein [Bartonella sp. HY038]|uniref:hypothetical protein n=1 Tax=Bartonella sp. HY038 TaxID=2759660 RepID=UPI0015FB3248|nr:hypothetical protein [Bartonella sp. HY038]
MLRILSVILLVIFSFMPIAYGASGLLDTDRLIEGKARDTIAETFTPGLYSITWFEPMLTPNLTIEKRELNRCYSAEDAKNGVNIALPPAQQASCKSRTTMVHDDIVFDTDCTNKAFQQLRVMECGHRLCGTYRYSDKDDDRIFEATVFIDKMSEDCP